MFPEMSPERDSTYGLHNIKRVNKEIILILSRRKTRFCATQVHCFMVMDCILIQEVKGLTKKLYMDKEVHVYQSLLQFHNLKHVLRYTVQEEDAIFHSGSLFILFTWLWAAL